MTTATERKRREVFRHSMDRLADVVCGRGRRPEPWQLDLAARILAHRYKWSIAGRGDIWSIAQMLASELGKDMQTDGRLNEWGNWPHD